MLRVALLMPLLVVPAGAQEAVLGFGTGSVTLHADEIVYSHGARISHLVWTTAAAPVLSAGLDVRWPDGLRIEADASLAASGISFMADYDWLGASQPEHRFEDWTDRSVHPDTRLDYYATGRVAIGHDLATVGVVTVGASAGARYTAVHWTAWGGQYSYSSGTNVGSFDPADRIISYQQQMPVGFLALDAMAKEGAWTLGGTAELGLAVGARDIDDHWLRDLRFIDSFGVTPVLRLGAEAAYEVSDRLQLTAGASFERLFPVRGDTVEIDVPTSGETPTTGTAGTSFTAVTLRAGVAGRF